MLFLECSNLPASLVLLVPSCILAEVPVQAKPLTLVSFSLARSWCWLFQASLGWCRKPLFGSPGLDTRSLSTFFLTETVRNQKASESPQKSIWEVVSWNCDFGAPFGSPAIETLAAPSCFHSCSETWNTQSPASVRSCHCAHAIPPKISLIILTRLCIRCQ